MSILPWIKGHLSVLFLLIVTTLLCVANFSPNTWLIGWDNLMPEMNIGMNIKRSLFAVWQEYQGLGLVGGMAHATDLIRQIILLPFSLIIPTDLIRYAWHFALLFLGVFGIYHLLQKLFKFNQLLAICGSLFYLLNFGTIQYFWAPLESFSAFWGFFPWLIYSLLSYLQKPSKLSTFRLLTFNLFAIPAFYVQTIFIVYLLCVVIILFSHLIIHKSYIVNHIIIMAIIIMLNAFWLLPLTYFVSHNLNNSTLGMGNIMSSEASFMRNQRRGTIPDFLLLRNYYYDFSSNGLAFMAPWQTHFANSYVPLIGYLFSTLIILGLIKIVFIKKDPVHLSLILLFLLSAIALLSATPPFSLINDLFRSNSLLNQIFRAPFTKFLVPAAFTFSCLIPFGIKFILDALASLKYKIPYLIQGASILFCLLLFFYSSPVFKGNFINPQLRQTIPPDYFELFSYLKSQSPTARIANLPQGNFWGWTNYRQGIHGSGFLWYGIQQPILDRAFDAWNLKNEQYYWQLTYALQSQDPDLLASVFSQYNIEFVLFDHNVMYLEEKVYAKLSLATQSLLPQVPGLTLEKTFGKSIKLYRFHQPTKPYLVSQLSNISNPNYYHQDNAFISHGDYFSKNPATYSYPYANIFSNRPQNELNPIITRPSSPPIIVKPLTSESNQFVRLSATNNQVLYPINFPQLTYDQGYLVEVTYRHLSGYPLLVSIASDDLKHLYTNILLEKPTTWQSGWFVIPPETQDSENSGITLLLDNTSFNQQASINDIKEVKVYPLDFNNLTKYVTPSNPPSASSRTYLNSQSSIFFYKVSIPTQTSTIYDLRSSIHLVLPQSFEPGWLAFYFDGFKPIFLKDHVLINNWSNGWFIRHSLGEGGVLPSTVYFLFWPQLLQFLGLALIPIVFLLSSGLPFRSSKRA